MIKMKKQNIIPIIALLALLAFITMPVSAYTQVSTCTVADAAMFSTGSLMISNQSAFDTITYMTRTGAGSTCYMANHSWPLEGSQNVAVRDHDWVIEAWGTVTWDIAAYDTEQQCDMSFTFINKTGTYHAGTHTLDVFPSFSTGSGTGGCVPSPDAVYLAFGGGSTTDAGIYTSYSGLFVIPPVASFSCTPTSQYPDTSVVCTDTSTNTPTSWLWTIDAEAMGIDAWQTHTGQNFTWESHYPGLYSVNLQATNTAGSDWENKTNYVSISVNATPNNCEIEPIPGYIRTYAQTNDGMTSGGIYNSNIQMHDMEGGAWSNVTNSGGWWCIDTLPGHSLNIYAQATGYTSAETLGASANGGRHYLVMWPDYIPAPSAGNVTLYALVYDQQTGAPLYLSMVRVDGNIINTVLTTTGLEGQAMFTIKNDTSIHVTASKTGYSSITKVITTSHFGPDTVMISLPRLTVTTIPTATPGPGGTTPVYIDPRTPNQKDADMMNQIRDAGPGLIGLAIVATIFGLIKLMTKK